MEEEVEIQLVSKAKEELDRRQKMIAHIATHFSEIRASVRYTKSGDMRYAIDLCHDLDHIELDIQDYINNGFQRRKTNG